MQGERPYSQPAREVDNGCGDRHHSIQSRYEGCGVVVVFTERGPRVLGEVDAVLFAEFRNLRFCIFVLQAHLMGID